MLTALKHAPRLAATPAELIAADPEAFRDTSVAGLHMTAASLVRKGLVKRGRRDSNQRLYRLTEAGKQA
jgi:DNA-binding MarR family transcriptional regulator